MEPRPLPNYLRTYRKKAGLTQQDFAFLLGVKDGAQVSRYEKGHRLPPLRTALVCEAVLGVEVSELFAGIRAAVENDVVSRIEQFKANMAKANSDDRGISAGKIKRKLQVLGLGRDEVKTIT